MPKVTQLKVTAMGDMSVAQLVKELAKQISGPALDFVSSQLLLVAGGLSRINPLRYPSCIRPTYI